MAKDEADIIQDTVKNQILNGCDYVYVYDNMSSDKTFTLLKDLQQVYPNIVVRADPDPAYYQAKKMNTWIQQIVNYHGMSWIIPFDADEFWIWKREDFENWDREGIDCSRFVLRNYIPIIDDNDNILDWRFEIGPIHFGKVAFKATGQTNILAGNHSAVNVKTEIIADEDYNYINHFQYRSFEQMKKKLINGKKAYDLTNLPPEVGNHWRQDWTDEKIHQYWKDFCKGSK